MINAVPLLAKLVGRWPCGRLGEHLQHLRNGLPEERPEILGKRIEEKGDRPTVWLALARERRHSVEHMASRRVVFANCFGPRGCHFGDMRLPPRTPSGRFGPMSVE